MEVGSEDGRGRAPEEPTAPHVCSVAPRGDDNAELFRRHCESECFDPQLMRADRLGDLIEAVVERTPRHLGKAAWTGGSATNAA